MKIIQYLQRIKEISTTVTKDECSRGMEKIQNRLNEIMLEFKKFPMSSVL